MQVYAQEELAGTDAITYDLFIRQDWKQLIKYSNKAIEQEEDFYYLRMRVGIAHYELKEYRKALKHFELAYAMNPNEEVLKEYLFYCYLYTGQYPLALKLSKRFSPEMLEKTSMKHPAPVYFANAEYGIKFSSNDSLYKPMHYFQAGLNFRIGRNITAYNAYTYITQQMYYGTLQQHQYFITLTLPFMRSWSLMPAFHFLNYSFSNITIPQPPPDPSFPPPALPNFDGSAIVAALGVSKHYGDFMFNGSASFSNINKARQYQQQLGAVWFPFHNNNLSLNAGTILFSNDSNTFLKPLPFAGISGALSPKVTVSASYMQADVRNYSEQNGYLVNNSYDVTHYRLNASVDWRIHKHWSVYALWVFESKTESYYHKDYHFNTAIAGIKLAL